MQSLLKHEHLDNNLLPPELIIKPEQLAETQGILCGFICGGLPGDGKPWMEVLLANLLATDSDLPSNKTTLVELYKKMSEQLANGQFNLRAFLPTKESNLSMRAQTLTNWCRGFMTGLEQTGLSLREEQLSDDMAQAFHRLEAISAINHEEIEIKDPDEHAFSEVVNYLQLATVMIYRFLNDLSPKKSKH